MKVLKQVGREIAMGEAVMPEDFLTVTEASERLSVSPRTIQRYCRQGRLNYKWVTGKRHRELRIIPPIPIGDLPGVKKKALVSSDIVAMEDFVRTVQELRDQLRHKDEQIEELEKQIDNLRTLVTGMSELRDTGSTASVDTEVIEKARTIIHDFNSVRPVEKKLILKMAKELKSHTEFLCTLGMKDDGKTADSSS